MIDRSIHKAWRGKKGRQKERKRKEKKRKERRTEGKKRKKGAQSSGASCPERMEKHTHALYVEKLAMIDGSIHKAWRGKKGRENGKEEERKKNRRKKKKKVAQCSGSSCPERMEKLTRALYVEKVAMIDRSIHKAWRGKKGREKRERKEKKRKERRTEGKKRKKGAQSSGTSCPERMEKRPHLLYVEKVAMIDRSIHKAWRGKKGREKEREKERRGKKEEQKEKKKKRSPELRGKLSRADGKTCSRTLCGKGCDD
ncbi:histone-lysine N-methyltransferase, H3 lysine-79 specific-like [Falco rusticolus]|uniref:histone-lysine N-methyltransferase, H3 lysine-79 specific-like n=1 Tax=Falco rusticolus TaxID=120794 RepID=UPI0018869CD2|nr:histone-lysine N-methyltransferase, H3 lysine-79 specific-like [Falco rusticolus]